MIKLISILLLVASCSANAQTLDRLKDYRIGTEVIRDASGTIKRSSAVLSAYQKIHPCPSTGLTKGACPGWSLNHVIPLACGGVDAVYNLMWQPNAIKSCANKWCTDRHEREINETSVPDTANCKNKMPIDLSK